MKELTIEQAAETATHGPQANGTAALADAPAPVTDAIPLTPDQRLTAFQAELVPLMERYGVRFAPYIKSYNDGSQAAALDFVVVQGK